MIHRLGKTDDGYIVVDIRLESKRVPEPKQTIEHEPVVGDLLEFAVSGERYRKGDRRGNPSSAGQMIDEIVDVTKPAAGWTLDEIAELRALWERWHLNLMRAGCAHQTVVWEDKPYRRPSLTLTQPCPRTLYRYGTAWLAEPLPDDVVARIRHLDRDRSQALYAERGYDDHGRPVRRFTVTCEDGQVRHREPFATRAEADTFADQGHACTNQHTITEYTENVRA